MKGITDRSNQALAVAGTRVEPGVTKVSKELLEKLFQTLDDERGILAAIMENTRTQLAYLDNQFNFIMVNTAYAKGAGFSREELIGRNHFELFPNQENQALFERVRQTGETLEYVAKPFEYATQPWRGVTYWDWSLVPLKDKHDSVQGLVLSLIEVTEQIHSQRRLEDALAKLKRLNEQLMEARRKAEQRAAELDAVFESMVDAVIIYDGDGRIRRANPVAISTFGMKPNDTPGPMTAIGPAVCHLSGGLVPAQELPVSRALRGERVGGECYCFDRCGIEKTLEVSAAPLMIRGKNNGVVTTWRDVTEREILYGQLEHERARLAAVLEQMPSGVVMVEASTGKLLMENKQAARIWRGPFPLLTVDAFRGQVFHGDGRPCSFEDWPLARSVFDGATVAEEEMFIEHHDGSRSIIQIGSAPIRDREGEIIAGVMVFSDITQRKEAEERLRLANQLQQIIEFMPDAIYVLDQDRRVIAWNRAMERLTGVAKPAVLGRENYYEGLSLFENRPLLNDYIWNGYHSWSDYTSFGREEDTFFGRIKLASQTIERGAYLEVRATPLRNEKGQIVGAIESIRDITRQQEIEEESLKAQKIESLGLLAGGIAHDFNNFLTAILANIQLASLKLSKGQDITHTLKNVENTSIKATNLTRQLLTFSKGGAPVKRATNLKELLRDTVEFVLRGSKVGSRFSIPDDLWMVNADAGQISQVIGNLAINAVQAMPQGGKLAMEAENVEIGLTESLPLKAGRYVKIAIADQGVGIPREHLGKIFDPYFTTKAEGNGLGLATSYFIISNHAGHINVDSTVGMGTVFTIYLPAEATQWVEQAREEAAALFGGRGRILIMDDDPAISQAAGEVLQELGYRVTYASDGKEAIDQYLESMNSGDAFDLVILDLTIPGGMGGRETLERLRDSNPDVKAIVSSGYPDDPVMLHYRDYGFSEKMVKPYKIELLSGVLRQILNRGPMA
jgi:PAS domain S-box-containing protein